MNTEIILVNVRECHIAKLFKLDKLHSYTVKHKHIGCTFRSKCSGIGYPHIVILVSILVSHILILAAFCISDIFVLSFTTAIWTDGCHKRSLVSMSIWGGTIHPAGMTRGQQARQPSPSVTPAPSDTRGHSVKLPTQRDSYTHQHTH